MSFKRLVVGFILSIIVSYSYPFLFNSVFASDPLNTWTISPKNMPASIASHNAVGIGGHLITLGGANSDDVNNVYETLLDNNGVLSNWNQINTLPDTRFWATTASTNTRVYVLGGASFNGAVSFQNTVFSAPISNGSLSSWTSLNALPQHLAQGGAVAVGDWLYYLGGRGSGVPSNTIYFASINFDGTVGAWNTSFTHLPIPMYAFGTVVYNNKIYIVGGVNSNGQVVNKVYRASVNTSDGSLSSFQEMSSLPNSYNGTNETVLVGNRIMTVGGGDNFGPLDKIIYTEINPDGSLQNWAESASHLPEPIAGGAAVYANGYIYYTGGYHNGYLNKVYYAKVNLETTLNVPLLKQTDPAWGSQTYDSSSNNISKWGCALTSAAMIFQYHGITKLPDGTILNPGTLNTWLKNRPKGYMGSGVNWMELQTLSKLAKSKNPSFNFDSLEFKKIYSYDPVQLKQDLQDNIPGILEVDNQSHFLVGTGTSGNTFTINDPFYNATLLSQVHQNTFSSLGRFVPSHSDLSYIEIAVDDGVTITVKDKDGSKIGQGFTQQSSSPDGSVKDKPLSMYYVQQPIDGNYTISLNSNTTKTYTVQILLYDKDGSLVFKDIKGVLDGSNPDVFSILFNKSGNSSSAINQSYSFDSLIADLDLLYSQKLITNLGVYLSMREHALQAKKNAPKNKIVARAIMGSLLVILETNHKKTIKEDAYQILKPEIVFLQNSLK